VSDEVIVEVDGKPVACQRGRPLLNELLNAGLVVETACGGQGTCHLCRVTVLDRDALPPPNAVEKKALGNVLIAGGMRLSCQIPVERFFRVRLPVVESAEARRERIRLAQQKKLSKP
jgi:Na+-transporting NADH:ubiquinone oxidoreductase subunit F